MASASLTTRFSELEVDAVPDAPRDVIPEKEKKEAVTATGCSPSVVSLHGTERTSITEVTKEREAPRTPKVKTETPASKHSPENITNRRSSGRCSSDMGRPFPHIQLPFPIPPVGSGGGNIVLVNQSNGVQVGDTFVYNSTNVTTPTTPNYSNVGSKPMKIDAEEKCFEDLRSVGDRVSIEEISAISTHVGVNWKVLGRRLKYTDGQLEQFYLNFEKLQMKEVVYQMLLDWKRTKTSKATIKSLAKHLYKSNEIDAMMELHKVKFNNS